MKRTLIALALFTALPLCVCLAASTAPEAPAPTATEASPCRPCAEEETAVPLPETESICLTRCDGEVLSEILLFHDELRSFREALPEIRGHQQEGWSPPEAPWPVYALSVTGPEFDYQAVCCCGVWLDNLGNTLIAGPDPAPLWERFGRTAREGAAPGVFPAQRELSLAGGGWDARFLVPAPVQEADGEIPMVLTAEDKTLSWQVENPTGQALTCGGSGSATLEVRLGTVWYDVPALSGAHYGYTMEGVQILPGGVHSGDLWWEPYGSLPNGTYRVRLSCFLESPSPRIAAAPFRLQNGVPVPLSNQI